MTEKKLTLFEKFILIASLIAGCILAYVVN